MTVTSRSPQSYNAHEAREVFFGDTEHILANFRYLLELPLLTDQQKQQVKEIMGSIFALRREIQES